MLVIGGPISDLTIIISDLMLYRQNLSFVLKIITTIPFSQYRIPGSITTLKLLKGRYAGDDPSTPGVCMLSILFWFMFAAVDTGYVKRPARRKWATCIFHFTHTYTQ